MTWRIQERLKELLAKEERLHPPPSGGEVNFVLAFANVYRLAMSNLGFQSVCRILGERPEIGLRRALLPDPEALEEHLRSATPWLALEDRRPVAEAEVIAFSLPFENDYLNVLTLLRLAGLPLLAGRRGAGQPLIVAGGIAPSLNPEPLADFLDLILIGEAEEFLDEFVTAYHAHRELPREELIRTLAAEVEGVYAPGLYRPGPGGRPEPERPELPASIPRRYPEKLNEPVRSSIITPEAEFAERPLIEISRGCARACRFCAAGHILRPPRAVDYQANLEAVERAAEESGRVGLVSAAVSDLPGIEELCLAATHHGAQVSVSSLRADTLSPALARILAAAGVQTLTLAPEAGSDRLRRVINKGLAEADILEAAQATIEAGIRRLRLYFMLGLPTETDDDIRAIATLVRRIRDHVDQAGGYAFNLISLSVSSFVPKPQTPFQWAAMETPKELKRRARLLRKELKGVGRVKIGFDQPRHAVVEGLLSRAGRSAGRVLVEVLDSDGDWAGALKAHRAEIEEVVHRVRTEAEEFPWEIVESGQKRDYLWAEYERGLAAKISPGCKDGCHRCGVC